MMLVIDWETTGLTLHPSADVKKRPRAIEFGAALLCRKTGAILETAQSMIDPQEEISAEITKITGITNTDVVGAPTFMELLPQLRRLFASADVLVAHNLPFDRTILLGELMRHDVSDFIMPPRGICTVGLYKDSWGRNPKLIELYAAVMGRPLAQTHRALDDVMALVEIIQKEELWKL